MLKTIIEGGEVARWHVIIIMQVDEVAGKVAKRDDDVRVSGG